MKIEKNKIVFGSVLLLIISFIGIYTAIILTRDKSDSENLKEVQVPELQEGAPEFKTKLDAINALKEVRETNAPSIYDEKLIDSLGYYDRELEEKKKEFLVDSIYATGWMSSPEPYLEDWQGNSEDSLPITERPTQSTAAVSTQELGLEHQLFFSSNPIRDKPEILSGKEEIIYAEVDGQQVVKTNSRLKMRLTQNVKIQEHLFLKNTLVYGFVSFQPNRVLITIAHIDHRPVELKAFDLQDGSEGIYVESSFRAQVTEEVIGDLVQDINIPSVPQLGSLRKVFQRSNRNVKVSIANNYQLILKPK
jgi:hypothetical protein